MDVSTLQLVLPESLQRLLAAVRAAGGRPLLVGGAVRDALAGLSPKDFDVEVYGLGVDALTSTLEGVGRVHSVGRSFGVLKVTMDGDEIDVSLPRRDSKRGRGHKGFMVEPDPSMTPEEAGLRRDFTVNALAVDPLDGTLIDPFGGRADLAGRRLRHVSPAFAEDPLRVLRGLQFSGRFDLVAEAETLRLSASLYDEYGTLAKERVWEEWRKWAAKSVRPAAGLRFLRDCEWWRAYPELVALAGCEQEAEWHPEGDVWEHTLLVCDAAAAVARREALDEERQAVLLLAAVCHDLGKPECTFLDDMGRVRSPGHADKVETFRSFLSRIGCPERYTEPVVGLCRYHLTHISFVGSKRHVRRLARGLGKFGTSIEMLGHLVEADHSGRPPLPGGMPAEMAGMLELARELDADRAAPQPLLGGRDAMALGVDPGPEMGALLREAFDAQLDGAFADLEGGITWLARRVASASAPPTAGEGDGAGDEEG